MINRQTSTAIRSSLFYAVHFAALGGVFSYYNVALIERGFTGMQIGLFSSLNSAIILLASPLLTGLAAIIILLSMRKIAVKQQPIAKPQTAIQ